VFDDKAEIKIIKVGYIQVKCESCLSVHTSHLFWSPLSLTSSVCA